MNEVITSMQADTNDAMELVEVKLSEHEAILEEFEPKVEMVRVHIYTFCTHTHTHRVEVLCWVVVGR